jgi:tyrosine-protein kinase Etk/Wzc
MEEHEPVMRLNLYDLLIILAKWRKLFIVNFFIVVGVATVIAFALPVWYKSTTVILPPSSSTSSLPAFLPKDLVGAASSFGLETPTEEIYQTVLGSRTLHEKLIERFNLREVYKMQGKTPEEVIDALSKHIKVLTREDQAIEISVEDRDPKRATQLCQACVEELDHVYRNITSTTARNNRTYIGHRLDEINDSLSTLQDSLMNFQKQFNAIALPEQTQAMITAAADLKAEQLSNDIKLEVMRKSFGDNHPQVLQLRSTSHELLAKYNDIIEGREGNLFLSLQQLPELGRKYAELLRKIRIQGSLTEYTYPQYESAKIQEEKESANVQVLDPAREPSKKYWPPRRLIVMIAAAASLLVTLVLILFHEYWHSLPTRNKEDWEKINRLRKTLKGG